MFSFRHDKVGFFSGLALLIVCGGTFIATLVLLIVGAALGDYRMFLWPIRWVLMGWWLGCIAIVVTRVSILNRQMKRRQELLAAGGEPVPVSNGRSAPPEIAEVNLPAEAIVARARAEVERYRAIGAIGVATVLGVASAMAIVSFLAVGLPEQPGAAPVQIVAWSVGGAVIVVVVLLCVIGLWRREIRLPTFMVRPVPPAPPAASAPMAPTGVQEHSTPT
jgi:O-antigen/teichoic acid export membrane protein